MHKTMFPLLNHSFTIALYNIDFVSLIFANHQPNISDIATVHSTRNLVTVIFLLVAGSRTKTPAKLSKRRK